MMNGAGGGKTHPLDDEKGETGMKWARTLAMSAGLAAVSFLLAAAYPLNLSRLLRF